jgi:hypothetical protein
MYLEVFMFRWLLGVLLVGLLSVTLLQPVQAQESFTITFDDIDDLEYSIPSGLGQPLL